MADSIFAIYSDTSSLELSRITFCPTIQSVESYRHTLAIAENPGSASNIEPKCTYVLIEPYAVCVMIISRVPHCLVFPK